ncbi:MAG: transposase, partial [Nitrospirae bacterium]|nr:transposase [Nitrospirota bacterium]
MARQLRIEFNGAFYHITSRGNLRDKIFYDDKDRERFLEILKRTKERYGYLIHAYGLMDNHYHLLMETPKANISQIMQNINTSYTVYINKKYRRSGHLMQGRFKGIIVDKDEYLVTLSKYIHLNPVRAKIVQCPEDYRWTSYRAYIDKTEKAPLVDTADTLSYFSSKKGKAASAYKAFVESEIGRGENPFKNIEGGIILGGERFKEKIVKLLDKMKADEEIPQLKRLREKVPIDKVIKACCSYYGKMQEELLRRGKNKPYRQIAIYLSKVLSNEKN